ncbi:unnamed protein product [Strongylus vulgaris]|uniref:Uncharacterized protein n=1 Tax=Strongylus vulgaris TaxID=40348 RepID=A0A3P7JAS4_STRVU|nr:unnamed protein product [Strongylus vulgaris]
MKGTSGDYNDYDDVTIPPNLTDLLANLPDDLSPETLQKMFRDSVDDRKALLEGFELLKKQLKVMIMHNTY